MPVVFIVSPEWRLRGTLRAELREAGIAAMGMETVDDMAATIARGIAPDLVVLDGVHLHAPSTRQSLRNLAAHVPFLVIDSRLNPASPLPAAELLFRPVQVKEIVARVLVMLGPPRS